MAFDVSDYYSNSNYIRNLGSLHSWRDVGRKAKVGRKCSKAARGIGKRRLKSASLCLSLSRLTPIMAFLAAKKKLYSNAEYTACYGD